MCPLALFIVRNHNHMGQGAAEQNVMFLSSFAEAKGKQTNKQKHRNMYAHTSL